MAFCRWSEGDVYCYEGEGGFVTEVAGGRRPPGRPEGRWDVMLRQNAAGLPYDHDEADRAQAALVAWRAANPVQPIDHPEAGASFLHATAAECLANLLRLRAEGFEVPQHAIEALREEAAAAPDLAGLAARDQAGR